ncbi:ATP-binding protein [Bdellovibrio sp. HCB-162]|uniref:sensor histidine kinase n=1 Tax=Bdellovibrio sp. HCB-162 TaxID=3394234 RepID=UPI0039BCB5B3
MFLVTYCSIILTLVLCAVLAVKIWPYRRSFLHRILLINQVIYVLWMFLLLLIFVVDDFDTRAFLTRLRPALVAIVPPNWFLMAWVVFYREHWERWKKWSFLLYVIPVVTIVSSIAALLNFPFAGKLILYNFAEMPGNFGFLSYSFGPVMFIFLKYSIFCLSGIYIFYFLTIFQKKGVMRRYAILFALGGLFHISKEIYARYIIKDMFMMQLSSAYAWPMAFMFYFVVTRLEFLDIKTLAQERVFKDLPSPVITLTARGELWDLNHAAYQLLNLHNRDLGKPARNYKTLEKIIENPDTVEIADKTYQIFYHGIKDSTGEHKASVYVLNDVDRIMELYRDLEESNAILRELNTEILRMTDFNRRIQTVLSHDMTGALSSVNILLRNTRELAEAKQQQDLVSRLETIQQANYGAVSLLRNILAWTQDEDHLETQDLEACLDAAWSQLSPQILQKNIQLQKTIPTKGLSVKCSRFAIESIFRNLLSNAIRYSPSQSLIEVSLFARENFVEILVADKGRGMTAETVNQILNRGRQRQIGEEGFGLGMNFTLGFIEKIHGQISIDSSVDHGTTVRVLLPTS